VRKRGSKGMDGCPLTKAHPCDWSPSKLLGMPCLILKVCEMLGMVVTSGSGASDGVEMLLSLPCY
jgi:hypothetical protein